MMQVNGIQTPSHRRRGRTDDLVVPYLPEESRPAPGAGSAQADQITVRVRNDLHAGSQRFLGYGEDTDGVLGVIP